MADESVQVAASAARGFKVFECHECARSIQRALRSRGLASRQIDLRGTAGGDFMICFSHDGGKNTITQNGSHTAFRVGDLVFDNLHPDGMSYELWLMDFDAIGGIEVRMGNES